MPGRESSPGAWASRSARRVPEQAQRAAALVEVPDARRDDAAGLDDAAHLAQTGDGIGHEVHDQLRQCSVERVARQRQPFGVGAMHLDARVSLADGCDERLGRIDRDDRVIAEPLDELGGEGPRTTADVEDPLAGAHAGEAREHGASGTEYLPMNRS